ncbi:T9SS type A sorting domain-containing protein [Flavobacterium chuncheonense]|uniref:T9SS type A sorting domain-containing protein n=1 Tax=Flavobacterium chuncheonense TaxID=2026653 RepID=A0ABW5YIQ1_9FLAO
MKNFTSFKYNCPIIILLFLNLFLKAHAQIIYTDIIPDYVSQNLGDSYNLDLNNDSTTDFTLISYNEIIDWFHIYTNQGPNNTFIAVTPWFANPIPLNNGDLISQTLTSSFQTFENIGFITAGDCCCQETICNYDWKDKGDKYLGVRFIINGQIHYGWARLNVSTHSQWTIKDYAYQATPNIGILAGQTTALSLNDTDTVKDITISILNKNIVVHNLNQANTYELYSITGQKISNGTITKENNSINTSLQSKGIYILKITDSESSQSIQKKLIL